jgi:capsular polysaccharide biosynthesis protein
MMGREPGRASAAPSRPRNRDRAECEAPVLSDDTVRLSTVGLLVRRRWRLLLAIAAVGALLGAVVSVLMPPKYVASTSALLQGPHKPDELQTETQIATSSVVLGRTAEAIGGGRTVDELRQSVNAKVGDGNVITIRGSDTTPEGAQQLADRVAQEYVRFSIQLASDSGDVTAQTLRERRDALHDQITKINDRITEMSDAAAKNTSVDSVQTRTELQTLRSELNDAMTKLDAADQASSQANIAIMGQAERPSRPAAPTMVQLVAGGAFLFLVLGVFGHLAAARRDRRLHGEPEIAAALGSRAVAGVDVPDEPAAGTQAGPVSWRTRLLRLVSDGQPWNAPRLQPSGDVHSRVVRYRRALARIQGESGAVRRLLVLVPDDDAIARRAAAQLAAAAGGPTDVYGRAPLRIVEISAARPTIPDLAEPAVPGGLGVAVVLTAGTRTGWELVGIAEACSDAGYDILGTVVAHRTRPSTIAGRPDQPLAATRVDGGAMAGSG